MTSNTNFYNNNLIGIDHQITINAYYTRDVTNNTNNNNTIVNHLTKLGYTNQNINNDTSLNILLNNIRVELTNNWNSNIRNRTINDLIFDTHLYQNNQNIIRITRLNELQPYINKNDTYDFYNHLTIEELSYLGY